MGHLPHRLQQYRFSVCFAGAELPPAAELPPEPSMSAGGRRGTTSLRRCAPPPSLAAFLSAACTWTLRLLFLWLPADAATLLSESAVVNEAERSVGGE